MTNAALDGVLILLRDKYRFSNIEYVSFTTSHRSDWKDESIYDMVAFLIEEGYITDITSSVSDRKICISSRGLKFLNEGGYTAKENYSKQTLRAAIQSRNFAMWALIVGIISVVIAFMALFR